MHHATAEIAGPAWQRSWAMLVIVLGTLTLCSCRAPGGNIPPNAMLPPNAIMANGSIPSLDDGPGMPAPGSMPYGRR